MAFILCQACGKQYSDKAPACPFCEGKAAAPPKTPILTKVLPAAKYLAKGVVAAQKAIFRNKKFKTDCPMCGVNLTMKIDTENPPEKYRPSEFFRKIGTGDCPFCKTVLTLVIDESENVRARDAKWDDEERKYEERSGAIEDEISELQDQLDVDEEEDGTQLTAKQTASIGKKIKTLQERLEKIESTFADRSDSYQGRQLNWQEKAERKLGS
jgi:uncharacterized Zn finger protein (UPF0148 family)